MLKLGGLYLVLRAHRRGGKLLHGSLWVISWAAYIETDMRTDLFSHLQKLSFNYYSETKVGQIMSRMTSDLFEVTEFSHHCPEEFFIAGIKIVAELHYPVRHERSR